MEPRLRLAVVLGAAVLLVGTVVVLRGSGEEQPALPELPPYRTMTEFRADGVLLPVPGAKPAAPTGLEVRPGSRRLVLSWLGEAAGYEVTWGDDRRTRLVAERSAQLDGLTDGLAYPVEVRAVDAFGQRSDPLGGAGTPRTPAEGWSFADLFDGTEDEVGSRWQLVQRPGCAWTGVSGGRLVVSANCGDRPTGLRARTPLRLRDNGGRVVLETDAPEHRDRLTVDFVPGPVDVVGDRLLPPGAIRVELATEGVLVRHPGGEARLPGVAAPPVGRSQRWEIVFAGGELRVVRDGQVLGATPVARTWRQATVLFGFGGRGSGVTDVLLDLVAFDGEPVQTPPLRVTPRVLVDLPRSAQPKAPEDTRPLRGTEGALLRMAVRSPLDGPEPRLTAFVNGTGYPVRPVFPGMGLTAGSWFPVVADLPAAALAVDAQRYLLDVQLRQEDAVVQLDYGPASLDLRPAAGQAADEPPANRADRKLPRPGPALAEPGATLLDAAGRPVPGGEPVAKGRAVIEIRLDGRAGQLAAGELAGLAGLEVRLDGDRLAVLPTAKDGPGAAGSWRIALNLSSTSAGPHTVEVRAVGTSWDTPTAYAFLPIMVARE
ncbi:MULTISPECIES: fibronectin type III domain-containing protein [unclassified Crossiella]|uniref:fibronectin type III domain-containing protein n=1 Tax=unclassified Crossiella TaxID=2620835 RepID=UPI001FFE7812|nr:MULTISPECIES: fibronectin type III domain-containing protein [unclassified Crossiella]MCK2237585.1 fibronectin type III domain-containing protein [Crossiella sp. S99.2]MCK2254871.1 fibronectin type III domain-containing protein [Crossiella sp. S99.1]